MELVEVIEDALSALDPGKQGLKPSDQGSSGIEQHPFSA